MLVLFCSLKCLKYFKVKHNFQSIFPKSAHLHMFHRGNHVKQINSEQFVYKLQIICIWAWYFKKQTGTNSVITAALITNFQEKYQTICAVFKVLVAVVFVEQLTECDSQHGHCLLNIFTIGLKSRSSRTVSVTNKGSHSYTGKVTFRK